MKLSSIDIERYSEVVENDGRPYALIHLGNGGGSDFTLCGLAPEGENGDNQMHRTRRRVTCTQCLAIIRYCKTIPNSVLNPPEPLTSQQQPHRDKPTAAFRRNDVKQDELWKLLKSGKADAADQQYAAKWIAALTSQDAAAEMDVASIG